MRYCQSLFGGFSFPLPSFHPSFLWRHVADFLRHFVKLQTFMIFYHSSKLPGFLWPMNICFVVNFVRMLIYYFFCFANLNGCCRIVKEYSVYFLINILYLNILHGDIRTLKNNKNENMALLMDKLTNENNALCSMLLIGKEILSTYLI